MGAWGLSAPSPLTLTTVTLTVAGGKEVLERGSVDAQTGHGVAFTVEVLERRHGTDVQLADPVVTDVQVRQSLQPAEVQRLVGAQHEPVHSQVQFLHLLHLGQSVAVQLLNLYSNNNKFVRPRWPYDMRPSVCHCNSLGGAT